MTLRNTGQSFDWKTAVDRIMPSWVESHFDFLETKIVKRLNALLNRNVISNGKLSLLFQSVAYSIAVGVFAACLFGTGRFATSPFEMFIGLVLSSILAIGLCFNTISVMLSGLN